MEKEDPDTADPSREDADPVREAADLMSRVVVWGFWQRFSVFPALRS